MGKKRTFNFNKNTCRRELRAGTYFFRQGGNDRLFFGTVKIFGCQLSPRHGVCQFCFNRRKYHGILRGFNGVLLGKFRQRLTHERLGPERFARKPSNRSSSNWKKWNRFSRIITSKISLVPYKVLVAGPTTLEIYTNWWFKGFPFIQLRVSGRLGAEGSKKCGHGSAKVVAFQAKNIVVFVELGCGDWVILRNQVLDVETLKASYDCVQAERCQEWKWLPQRFGGWLRVLESCFYSPSDWTVFEKGILTLALQPAWKTVSIQYSHGDLAIIPWFLL